MTVRFTTTALFLTTLCFADTLMLRDGRVVEGTFVNGDAREIRMAVGSRVDSFPITDVRELRFGGGNASRAAVEPYPAPAPQPYPAQTPPPYPVQSQQPYPPATPQQGNDPRFGTRSPEQPQYSERTARPAPGGGYQVPAGTVLAVRMIDGVDSERDRPGQTFRASLDEPVMADGQVIIPRGVDVTVKLVNANQSGTFRGQTELTLDVESLQVNGRRVDVLTQDVTQASEARGRRTTETVGGGTALGAIIGAIAGGGKGAAIGAVSGAAVGAGAQVITKGQKVKIPAETRLSFTLQQPIYL